MVVRALTTEGLKRVKAGGQIDFVASLELPTIIENGLDRIDILVTGLGETALLTARMLAHHSSQLIPLKRPSCWCGCRFTMPVCPPSPPRSGCSTYRSRPSAGGEEGSAEPPIFMSACRCWSQGLFHKSLVEY